MAAGVVLFSALAEAHVVTRRDPAFVQSIDGPAIGPFLYLGAKPMVTGYDPLLFLVGVIFSSIDSAMSSRPSAYSPSARQSSRGD